MRTRSARSGGIPAGAGTSTASTTTARPPPDYPHRCGDERLSSQAKRTSLGLPPQVRGRGVLRCTEAVRAGTIPAGAGTSHESVPLMVPCIGLSPQARGRGRRPPTAAPAAGTIPAGAGTSRGPCSCCSRRRDYPHRRGDEFPGGFFQGPPEELPPQVRGRADLDRAFRETLRTTPAGAGTRVVAPEGFFFGGTTPAGAGTRPW